MAGHQSEPRVLTITTSVTPLANVRSYNYVGYFEGTSGAATAGEPFGASAKVKNIISDRTGVTAPWPRIPIKFRVNPTA